MDVPLFEFRDLGVRGDDDRWRLRGVSGSIARGALTVLVGRSGSGKSTLLRCCNRLEVPAEGSVLLDGHDLGVMDPLALRRRVGMVFQRPTPFPGTGRENLQVADRSIDDRAAAELLATVGLDAEFLDRDAQELSGGEAQRLCLARSLAARPEVVLMDEVTSAVDPAARRALEDLARGLVARGLSVLWVTHDLEQAGRLADDLLVVVDGHLASPSEATAFLEDGDGG